MYLCSGRGKRDGGEVFMLLGPFVRGEIWAESFGGGGGKGAGCSDL